MNADARNARPVGGPVLAIPRRPAVGAPLTKQQWRQLGLITLGAIAIFVFMRRLPTGTNLSHMDFRVNAKNSIEFCDPLNPQFIPVVAVASPVTMTLSATPAIAGEPVTAVFTLRTASGKPIAPEDLLVVHTQRLHLLIIDPTLTDYQHVHPSPKARPGDWGFQFTPKRTGVYRIFADFTPTATSRGLYANTELNVSPRSAAAPGRSSADAPVIDRVPRQVIERDGYRFALVPAVTPIRVRQPADLKFTVSRPDGGPVPLQLVMDSYAHLVAFDEARMGFAHLHPTNVDLSRPPDALRPTMSFKIMIPTAGRYVIWAQINLGGRERFFPFWFDVVSASGGN